MNVVKREPVPIYEEECYECHSVIRFRKSELGFGGRITCPVCGVSIYANTLQPVEMLPDYEPVEE